MAKKIAVIGAGSSYTPELLLELENFRDSIDISDIALMDLNDEKLSLIHSVYVKTLQQINISPKIHTTTHLEDAVDEADFVILQIRVGGLNARIRDETVPMKYDMVGNETTGAGGFVCALRTVPVIMNIFETISKHASNAYIFNLSNPAGIVTEALLSRTGLRSFGFCNIPINTTYELADFFHVQPEEIFLDSFGLNHLSWTRGVYINDQELLQPYFDHLESRDAAIFQEGLVEPLMDPEVIASIRMIPSWYVRYFYYPEAILAEEKKQTESRGADDKQAEKRLKKIFEGEGFTGEAQQILKDKGGAQYYLPVMHVIQSIVNDRGDVVVIDTLNKNALPDLPQDVCVEVPAKIYKDRVEPLISGPMPLKVRGLVQTIKTYEQLTVEAAITGDRKTAISALMANPLVSTYPKASSFFDEVLKNEKGLISKGFYS